MHPPTVTNRNGLLEAPSGCLLPPDHHMDRYDSASYYRHGLTRLTAEPTWLSAASSSARVRPPCWLPLASLLLPALLRPPHSPRRQVETLWRRRQRPPLPSPSAVAAAAAPSVACCLGRWWKGAGPRSPPRNPCTTTPQQAPAQKRQMPARASLGETRCCALRGGRGATQCRVGMCIHIDMLSSYGLRPPPYA